MGKQFLMKELVPVYGWTKDIPVEESALAQIKNIAGLPFIFKHVAIMPDVHWGMGATVGSVIATKGAIIPAAVGVDIGCGMIASRTNLKASDLPDSLVAVRSEIERLIPHGRTDNGGPGDRGAWHDVPEHVVDTFIPSTYDTQDCLAKGLHKLVAKHNILERASKKAMRHLGTLGSGNHFVEICIDENQDVWIMLHSGSRGIGNAIGSYFIEKAKEDMERYFINLPDHDLAYLPEGSEYYHDYLEAVSWAQEFASTNRQVMLKAAYKALNNILGVPVSETESAINCHHNYVTKENHYGSNVHVTRKGAVRAREGDLGIIPGSMGAKSFIVRGKGNPESFCSCSHGAGRVMGRAEAKRKYTVEDQIKATLGVECRKDADVIDEIPMAYKDIDAVIAAQSDLIDVVHTLKQVLCVKG